MQRQIAHRTFTLEPDFVMITGDIVYSKGLVPEYRKKFWPIYNADESSTSSGAPLLRSTLSIAAPGNHDIALRDLDKTPDGLAYFYYWYQPLNGPTAGEGTPLVARVLGSEANKKAFTTAAGGAFPRMANFSFDYANTHWTILDANATVDWTNPELQEWVARDLAAARGATWRFVNFHQPGFNSSKSHFDEQYMRILRLYSRQARSTSSSTGTFTITRGHTHSTSCLLRRMAPHRSSRAANSRKPGTLTVSTLSTNRLTACATRHLRESSTSSPAPAARTFTIPNNKTNPSRGRYSRTSTFPGPIPSPSRISMVRN